MPDAAVTHVQGRPPTRLRVRPWVWWFGLAGVSIVAAVLSMIAYQQGLPFDGLPHFDKLVHFSIGGGLAFFLDGVLRRRMLHVGPLALPLAAVLVLVPAGVEEFLQRYSVNRSSSLGDFAADALGVACMVWLSRRLSR